MNFHDHIQNNSTLVTSWSELWVDPQTEVEHFDSDSVVEVTLIVKFKDGDHTIITDTCRFWEFDASRYEQSHFEGNQEVVEQIIKSELIDRLLGE